MVSMQMASSPLPAAATPSNLPSCSALYMLVFDLPNPRITLANKMWMYYDNIMCLGLAPILTELTWEHQAFMGRACLSLAILVS